MAYNYNQVKNFIEIESNSGCKLLSTNYNNVNEILKVKCKCGNLFGVSLNKFKSYNQQSCFKCNIIQSNINSAIKKYEQYKYYIESNSNCKMITSLDTLLHDVENTNIAPSKYEFKIQCSECSNVFKTTMSRFKERNKTKCYDCSIKDRSKSYEEVKQFIEEESNCILLSNEYIDCSTKLDLRCWCGKKFKVSYDKFKNQFRRQCANHSFSTGENIIAEYLTNDYINFIPQYSFNDCIGVKGKKLEFDFAIFNDSQLDMLIEYDGEQHFEVIEYWGGEEGLKYRQQNDAIKNKYCNDNDIKLLRIPYWEKDNILNILSNEIKVGDN